MSSSDNHHNPNSNEDRRQTYPSSSNSSGNTTSYYPSFSSSSVADVIKPRRANNSNRYYNTGMMISNNATSLPRDLPRDMQHLSLQPQKPATASQYYRPLKVAHAGGAAEDDNYSVAEGTVATAASTVFSASTYASGRSQFTTTSNSSNTGYYYSSKANNDVSRLQAYETQYYSSVKLAESTLMKYKALNHQTKKVIPKDVVSLGIPQDTLDFGLFSADAIASQMNCQVVFLEASQLAKADVLYSMMASPEAALTTEWKERYQMIPLTLTKYQARQVLEASRQTVLMMGQHSQEQQQQQADLPYLVTNTEFNTGWEFVCEEDTQLIQVAMPVGLLARTDIPCLQDIMDWLCNTGKYPDTEHGWQPGVLLVVKHLCQIHGIPCTV